MIVLSVHNSYQQPGGEDVVFEQEGRILEEHGHTIHRYQAHNRSITSSDRIAAALSSIWSWRSYRAVTKLVRQTGCDVVHFHNIFPLISPSAYYAAKDCGVPVVQTLHNYRALCPNALLFQGGRVCEECLGAPFAWGAIQNACYRRSRIASASVAAMLAIHRALDTWDRAVDLYIAPSRFCRNKYIEAGFDPSRIAVKPGFVHPNPGLGGHSGDYCLFAGRLSEEKGFDVLFDAWRKLGPAVPLKIVGDGPLSPLIAAAVREMPWIEWLGYRTPPEVLELIGDARLLVFPCQAYTTFGLVVVEAFAKGTPAIVPRSGALGELVRDGHNGLHFDTGSSASLAKAVRMALADPVLLDRMGRNARDDFRKLYTAEANLDRLLELYGDVTDSHSNRADSGVAACSEAYSERAYS